MARQSKTPRQRAEEQLGSAQRAVERLTDKRDVLALDLEAVERYLAEATRRRDFLAKHPDLPPQPAAPARLVVPSTSTGDNT